MRPSTNRDRGRTVWRAWPRAGRSLWGVGPGAPGVRWASACGSHSRVLVRAHQITPGRRDAQTCSDLLLDGEGKRETERARGGSNATLHLPLRSFSRNRGCHGRDCRSRAASRKPRASPAMDAGVNGHECRLRSGCSLRMRAKRCEIRSAIAAHKRKEFARWVMRAQARWNWSSTH